MKVVKKDNREESFQLEKLEISIENSARDIKLELNKSDLKLISRSVLKKITMIRGADGKTSSYEIIGVTVNVLKEDKFDIIIPSYLNLI